jgi:hypothetical protein
LENTAAEAGEQVTKAERNGHTYNHLEAAQRLFTSTYHVQPDALNEQWSAYKTSILGKSIDDSDLTDEQLARVHGSIVAKQKEQAQQAIQQQGQQHQPARTSATVQAFFAKQYQVKPVDLDTRWAAFKKHVLKIEAADNDLTGEQLDQLNGYISRDWQERQSQRSVRKVS